MGKITMVLVMVAVVTMFLSSSLVEGKPDPRSYSYPQNPLMVSPEEANSVLEMLLPILLPVPSLSMLLLLLNDSTRGLGNA
ncbi:unnamed protein product [Cyprideis torosa]|uniref:Uncharacterized protein n=1 Tax=Cyprideis torosa TaxID=163714 RepID=A0A7R8ZL39_9CRUS|nr:unnamed protein product [Cyprideis torosa]CAG0892486.1 unnamed protein product [Cyprideis torosa]